MTNDQEGRLCRSIREVKKEIIAAHATSEGDTGSPEVQVALLTQADQ